MRLLTRYAGIGFAIAAGLLCMLQPKTAHASGTPKGTSISNTATSNYSDPQGTSYTSTSNPVTVSVTAIYRVEISCGGDLGTGSGTTVYYPCTVTNTSNDASTFTLTAASDWGPTVLYADNGAGGGTANDGIHGSGETTVTASTGALAADATYQFFLGVPVPAGTANGQTKPATVTASGNGASKSVTVTTTAQTPVLSVVKKVRNYSESGSFNNTANAKPEQELEYQVQVTNDGVIQATGVILYDTLDTNLDFVSGTLRAGSSPTSEGGGNSTKSDDKTGDGTCGSDSCAAGNYDSTSRKITFYLGKNATETAGGTMNNASTVYVYYHVKVK